MDMLAYRLQLETELAIYKWLGSEEGPIAYVVYCGAVQDIKTKLRRNTVRFNWKLKT